MAPWTDHRSDQDGNSPIDRSMHLILYVFLVVMLLGIGVRALAGRGLALTLLRSYHGPAARPLGALFIVGALALALWLAWHPELASFFWNGTRQ